MSFGIPCAPTDDCKPMRESRLCPLQTEWGSLPKAFRDREANHDRLEGMFMDVGPGVRVGGNFPLQPIHVPELSGGSVCIQDVVYAKRGAPTRRKRVVRLGV